MLENNQKTTLLYKSYLGYGDSRPDKEVFEEPYKSFHKVFKSSVLTFGSLIPASNDADLPITIAEVRNLKNSAESIIQWRQSNFRTWDIIKYVKNLRLTPVSSNANDSFIALDENGNQIKNVIPFDFFEDAYNYTLKNSAGDEIPYGVCDWSFDVNSSILTFYNGVPEGIDAQNPPTLSFYQYVGPTGDQTYLDGLYADFEASVNSPVTDVTDIIKELIEGNLGEKWYESNFCNGSDVSEGIPISLEKITPVIYTASKDPLNGYDSKSSQQVVSQLSNVRATSHGSKILYASQSLAGQTISCTIPEGKNFVKVEKGWFYSESDESVTELITFEATDKLYNITLLRNENDPSVFDIFEPRGELNLTFKVPLIADIASLPPTMKLNALNSYSDSITPQYYGPRTADCVIASESGTVGHLSADVLYYEGQNTLSECINQADAKAHHFLIRNASNGYEFGDRSLTKPVVIRAEAPGVELKNGTIKLEYDATLIGFHLSDIAFEVGNGNVNLTLIDCQIDDDIEVLDHSISLCLLNSHINGKLNIRGVLVASNRSSINYLVFESGQLHISASSIGNLKILSATDDSIIDTTSIRKVVELPYNVKLESSYATEFDSGISAELHPSDNSIAYYKEYNRRVYANLPKTFSYNPETHAFEILTDNDTIKIAEDGSLYCRTLNSSEIEYNSGIETQAEDTDLHRDFESKEAIRNVADAIKQLFWEKADLKNGKVPLQQLPDSVAYGGLHYVGMWSFESNEGKYPTFGDINNKYSLDKDVDELQPGWFFICDGSTKEDDPAAPQTAIDGEVFTAGDWIIYSGKDSEGNLIWDKIDRAYQEAAMARLPSLAPYDGKNNPWSYKDEDGEGLFDLALKTISEAFKLVNIELRDLQPATPTSIRNISLEVLGLESNEVFEYCSLNPSNSNANGYIMSAVKKLIKRDGNEKPLTVRTKRDDPLLPPLDQCFYVGSQHSLSFTGNDVEGLGVDEKVFDPYEEWHLGVIPRSSDPKAAYAEAVIGKDLEEDKTYKNLAFNLVVEQSERDGFVKNLEPYCGQTKELDFEISYKEVYDFSNVDVQASNDWNSNDFNVEQFGVQHLIKEPPKDLRVKVEFKNAFKDIVPANIGEAFKAKATLFDGQNAVKEVELSSVSGFELKIGDTDGYCNASATFVFAGLFDDINTLDGYVLVEAAVCGFGYESQYKSCFRARLRIMRDASYGPFFERGIQVKSGSGAYPIPLKANSDNFGMPVDAAYLKGAQGYELIYDNYAKSYRYRPDVKMPSFESVVNDIEGDFVDSSTVEYADSLQGITIGSKMRFVTIVKELGKEIDLSGFKIHITWDAESPTINLKNGSLDEVAIAVGLTDGSSDGHSFDGNKIVAAYHVPEFTTGEGCCHPGKSNESVRTITFGRKTIPATAIYVRLGLSESNLLAIKDISIDNIH